MQRKMKKVMIKLQIRVLQNFPKLGERIQQKGKKGEKSKGRKRKKTSPRIYRMTEEDSYTTTPQNPTFVKASMIRFDTFTHRSLAGKAHLNFRCSLAVFWSKCTIIISRAIGPLQLAITVV